MSYLLFALYLLWSPTADTAHEYHVSKSRINYDIEARAYQFTLHLFIDDLEAALHLRGLNDLYLGTEREVANADQYITTYLRDQFRLTADAAPLTYTMLGKEVSDDLMGFYLYLEVADTPPANILSITNRLLTEVHDDQRNIVQVQTGDKLHGYFICTREDPSGEVVLE